MLKKLYKKDGIIVINNDDNNNYSIDFYNYMINHYQKDYKIKDYLQDYYKSKGFIY